MLSAKSAGGETASTNITVNIEPQDEAPVYLDDTIGMFHYNQSYNDAVTTRAWPLATYTMTGATPTGVTFNLASATFTGTPSVADQTYDFTVIASNRAGDTPRHYVGTVQSPPTLFTDSDTGVFVLDRAPQQHDRGQWFPRAVVRADEWCAAGRNHLQSRDQSLHRHPDGRPGAIQLHDHRDQHRGIAAPCVQRHRRNRANLLRRQRHRAIRRRDAP